MAKGGKDATPDDGGNPEDGPILSPEELDIAQDEHVQEIDEGRFVVSPNEPVSKGRDPGANSSTRTGSKGETAPSPQSDQSAATASPHEAPTAPPELDGRVVHEWLDRSFRDAKSRYGFDVTATFDGTVAQRRMASNDVVTIFESLVLWYAQQVDSDTPVEEVLGILLVEANVPVRYPPKSLRRLLDSTDLDPDDSIADLLAAVEAEDGVEL